MENTFGCFPWLRPETWRWSWEQAARGGGGDGAWASDRGAAHAGPQGGISRPRLLAVAALPWAGAWLLPSPRLSSPRLPREPEKRVRGDTCPAGETAFPRTGNLEAGVTSTATLEDAPNVSQRLRVIFAETGHSTDSLSLAIWADPPSGLWQEEAVPPWPSVQRARWPRDEARGLQ